VPVRECDATPTPAQSLRARTKNVRRGSPGRRPFLAHFSFFVFCFLALDLRVRVLQPFLQLGTPCLPNDCGSCSDVVNPTSPAAQELREPNVGLCDVADMKVVPAQAGSSLALDSRGRQSRRKKSRSQVLCFVSAKPKGIMWSLAGGSP